MTTGSTVAKSKRSSEAAYRARKAEQLAREQERARERRRVRRTVGLVLAVAAVAAVVVVIPALRDSPPTLAEQQAAADAQRPLADFGVGGAAADCTEDVREAPKDEWTTHARGTVEYDALPPAGGPHSQRTLAMGDDRFYARDEQPAPERAVHDLEHGVVVVWYDGELPAAEVTALRQVAAAAGDKGLRMVAVPWARGSFPDGQHLAITAWGVTKRCTKVSGAVVESFVRTHADAPGLPERGFDV